MVGRNLSCNNLPPDAAVVHPAVGSTHGLQSHGDHRGVLESILSQLVVNRGEAHIHPGVVSGGFLYPEGTIAVDGLAACIGCDIAGDIDGKELVLPVPLILLSDL